MVELNLMKLFRKLKIKKEKKIRLRDMKKNPYKRVDSEKMTDIEKMDKGFNGKTFVINGIEIDFLIFILTAKNFSNKNTNQTT